MKNSEILILGNGYIAHRLKDALGCQLSTIKITSYSEAEDEILKIRPKVIINTIGNTGKRNIDDCELDKDKTLLSNTFVPIILAEVALRNNIKLVHISSGCIYHYDYDSDVPLIEEKIPDFYDLFYSRSKIYADCALQPLSEKFKFLILRIRIPIDNQPHPRNTLSKIISFKKVLDIPNSVTYIPDFIDALKHLIDCDAYGIYNVVNKGGLRYPKILDVYKKYKPDFEYSLVDLSTLKIIRTNVVLSTEKLEKSGFKVRHIDEVIEECVKSYIKY